MRCIILILSLLMSSLLVGQCPVLRTCDVEDEDGCGQNNGSIEFTYTGGSGEPIWELGGQQVATGSSNDNLIPGVYFITIPGPDNCDLLFCIKIRQDDCDSDCILVLTCKIIRN